MTARRTVRWFHDVASPDSASVLGGFPLQLVLEESSIDDVFVAVTLFHAEQQRHGLGG